MKYFKKIILDQMWILAVGKENFSFFLLKSNKRILMKGDW
jgi:hypothetical protein